MLDEQVAAVNVAIIDETQRITKGIREAKAAGLSMHKDYWHDLHKLREKRRTLLAVQRALEECAAELAEPS